MAQAAFSSNPIQLPSGVTERVNNSLYGFYKPSIKAPEVDVIFFHGLQLGDWKDAYWKTWSSDGETIWPRTLLGEVLPNARILSVSYDSSLIKSSQGRDWDLDILAEELVQDIIECRAALVGQDQRPVVLVGHSLGGIVIQKFIMKAVEIRSVWGSKNPSEAKRIQTIDNFLESFCGVFYYAPPHSGSKLADLVVKFPGCSEVLYLLTTQSKERIRLKELFRRWCETFSKKSFTICETCPTNFRIPIDFRNPISAVISAVIWAVILGLLRIVYGMQSSRIVVEECSARIYEDGIFLSEEDHRTVCKPKSIIDPTFSHLYNFIKTNVPSLTKSAENP